MVIKTQKCDTCFEPLYGMILFLQAGAIGVWRVANGLAHMLPVNSRLRKRL